MIVAVKLNETSDFNKIKWWREKDIKNLSIKPRVNKNQF